MARSLRRRAARLAASLQETGTGMPRPYRLILAALVLGVPTAARAQKPVEVSTLQYAVLYADESGVSSPW